MPYFVSKLLKHLCQESNPEYFDRIITFVTVISYLKKTALLLASFFYPAWFLSYRNHPHQELNSKNFLEILPV
jgi:hypothetical protein